MTFRVKSRNLLKTLSVCICKDLSGLLIHDHAYKDKVFDLGIIELPGDFICNVLPGLTSHAPAGKIRCFVRKIGVVSKRLNNIVALIVLRIVDSTLLNYEVIISIRCRCIVKVRDHIGVYRDDKGYKRITLITFASLLLDKIYPVRERSHGVVHRRITKPDAVRIGSILNVSNIIICICIR